MLANIKITPLRTAKLLLQQAKLSKLDVLANKGA
jgi:hypothetical protein